MPMTILDQRRKVLTGFVVCRREMLERDMLEQEISGATARLADPISPSLMATAKRQAAEVGRHNIAFQGGPDSSSPESSPELKAASPAVKRDFFRRSQVREQQPCAYHRAYHRPALRCVALALPACPLSS